MNISKLHRMIAVHEAGSFRKAAKRFGMSQPALTWSIRQLEESLGVALFERGPRGIRPTPTCDALVVRARLIVNEHQRLLTEVERSNGIQAITIGVHAMLLNSRLATTIAAFRRQAPGVVVRVVEGYSSDLVAQLRQGDLDLALSAAPPADEDGGQEIAFEPLLRQQYCVFAHPDHPVFERIARGLPIPPQDWVEADSPRTAGPHQDSDRVFDLLERFGMTEQSAAVRSASMHFVRHMVLEGGMLGMVPTSQFANELRAGTVRQVPGSQIEGPMLGLLSIEGMYKTQAVRDLMALLRTLESADPPGQHLAPDILETAQAWPQDG